MSRQRAFVNVLLVYILLFASAGWVYNTSKDKYLIVAFLASFLAWFLFSDRKIHDKFLLYVVVFSGFLFSLYLYTAGSLPLSSAIASIMKLVIAYFVIKTVGERFVDTYINVVIFLAVCSLFGYMTDIFSLFDGIVQKLPRVGDARPGYTGYEGVLYVYRFPWHIERNNSIFYEPGAYQPFLNAALFLLFFIKNGFSTKRQRIYIILLIVTLATTFSTAGFIIFIVLFAMFLYRSKVLTFSGKMKIVGLIFAVVSIFSTQFYSTFVEKVNNYLSAHEYEFTGSASLRSASAKTDLKVFKKHIFGLGHEKYYEEFGVAGRVESRGSSNGVTRTLALYGLPFSIFLFGSYYLALKRLLNDFVLVAGGFLMLMLFLASQSFFVMAPICFSIVASAFIFKPGAPKGYAHSL